MAKNSGTTRQVRNESANPNGQPGMYTVYRIGGNASDSGLIFTSPSFEYTDSYGSTEHHKGKDTLEYRVEIKNPLVIELDKDVRRENTDFTDEAFKRLVGSRPSSNQLSNDRKLATALTASPYDAILYKGKDGRVLEIAIKPSMLGQGKKTRQSDVFSRRWGQTKQEFINEWIDRYISWGNSPKDARKFAYEQAAQEEKNWEKGR